MERGPFTDGDVGRAAGAGAGGVACAHTLAPSAVSRKVGVVRAVRSSSTAMRFDPLLPFEAWTALGARIALHSNASAWWLGDWLVYGREKYGRRYKHAIAATGLDYQTLRNYAVVARRFEPSRRRDDLTFQHHAELTALTDDDQDHWLQQAAVNRWSKQELRGHVRAALGAGDRRRPRATVRLSVDGDQRRRWREAAERSQCGFDVWATQVLDEAAKAVLSPSDV